MEQIDFAAAESDLRIAELLLAEEIDRSTCLCVVGAWCWWCCTQAIVMRCEPGRVT